MTSTGLAFSGGGIRSAALCSGVLRRLLHRGVHVDYVSCVSGGNYTAAAYTWIGNTDTTKRMTIFGIKSSLSTCAKEWATYAIGTGTEACKAFWTIIMVALLLTVNLVIPCVMYSAGAFPAAVIIDIVFGNILREGECEGRNATTPARGNRCVASCVQFDTTDLKVRDQSILFVALAIILCVCHVVKVSFAGVTRPFAHILEIIIGLLFAFTFIPWLIHQFSDVLPNWLKISAFISSIFFWLGFPPLRNQTSFAIFIYFYAFVITWRVYQCRISFLPEYRQKSFYELLLFSSLLIWVSPYIGIFSAKSTFTYYK